MSFNKNANPEVGKKSSGAGADTSSAHIHQVPSRIPRCLAMSFDLEQGPRRLLHRIEPTVLGLFPILSTKTVSASIKHQNINPTGSISAKVSKPQTHQAMVGPFEQPVLVSSSDHSTASMFLFVRAWSSSQPRRSREAVKTPCCKKCHNVSPLFAEERIRGYVPLIVIDRSLSKWLASFLPKLRHKGHKGSKTTDVSLYSTAFLYLSSKFVFVRIPTPRK